MTFIVVFLALSHMFSAPSRKFPGPARALACAARDARRRASLNAQQQAGWS
eukprot:CAMPEP_0197922592 /NCGR_PEP_ID=MMETSP1439-20131203/92557_1 /TAXON_ID=66791 /ORGANISM="Gonyaulax spinifera, Strain CCMP409" /LENGTH=50 /DNA_ID=CAMNT_0043544909 /DNA_START=1 /DNA_END=153 /DNA_ORIENTATION=+